jgi:hypothetical protein
MSVILRKALFSEPVGPLWKWRHLKLAFVIAWVVAAGWNDFQPSHSSVYVRFEHVLLALLVSLIFLTTDFRWRRSIFVALRIATLILMLLAFVSLWCSLMHWHA